MAALNLARRTAATVVAATMSLSCSSGTSSDSSRRPGGTGGMESVTPRDAAEPSGTTAAAPRLPERPAAGDPVALAEQLERVTVTLRDGGADRDDVRRAGRLQQLAVRAVAAAPGRFRGEVLARLDPATAVVTRACVEAARALGGLSAPQQRLPRWRIVTPPPPGELRGYYAAAQRRTGVPWTYLAAINLVETRMGRIRGTSTAGARGPMQFLPSTWELYGGGGDIDDPRDAILAAGRLLRANGAPGDMAEALWHYNPSDSYVRAVTAYARSMHRADWAYRGYWQWRVLYRHVRGTYVLPFGYPRVRPVLLEGG